MHVEIRRNKMTNEYDCTEEIPVEVKEAKTLPPKRSIENFYLIQNIIILNSEETIESCK